jgi:hypothetical protein
MIEAFVKVSIWRWFLDVRSTCKGKLLGMVPRR